MATAAPPGASRGRNPSSSSTVPKKLTDDRSEPARSGVPATPAQVTMPDSVPGPGGAVPAARAVASAMARTRSSGRERSATTSASRRSMLMTRQPAAPSLAAVARPIPDAAPVMTTVRSGIVGVVSWRGT